MKRLLSLALITAISLAAHAAEFEANILVDGKPARVFEHIGKHYIEGSASNVFTVQLKNNTAARALFTPSIDGLSVLDGEKAGDGGYVVGPYQTYEITGWRTSLDETRKFVFATKASGETYSEKTGRGTENCGVIGVRVFREKQPILIQGFLGVPAHTEYSWFNSSNLASSTTTVNTSGSLNVSATSSTGFDLGTKMGTAQQSVVKEVGFDRGELAVELTTYYASMSGLVSLGIDVHPRAFAKLFCKPVE